MEDAGTETLTKGMHCSVCGEVLQTQIPKSGGRWTDDGNYDATLYASEPGNWVISDAADLAAFAKKVNDGNSFEGFTVTLTADIDLSAHLWVPIGYTPKYFDETSPFRGIFRGGLHTVSGMRGYMDGNAENWAVAGLFGLVCGAEITDLQVSGNVIFFSKPQQRNCVGGLAGHVKNSTLRNCGFVGTVCGDSLYRSYVTYRIGGLAGYCTGATVENCYAIANVNAMNIGPDCYAHTGGLLGKADSSATVSNCYAAAAVTLKTVAMSHCRYGTFEGGDIGDNNHATANSCYTQIASVGPNGSATVLTREQMQSADGLVKMLNAYVSENGNEKDRGWFVDPTVNQGYPTFGLTVRFETGIEGKKGAVVGENGLHERVCEICSKVEPAAYTSVVTEPTCTERGFTTYTCSRCSESYISDYSAPLGHSFDNGTVTKEPTSTEKGEILYTCTVCGYTEKSEIAKLPDTGTTEPPESNPDTGAAIEPPESNPDTGAATEPPKSNPGTGAATSPQTGDNSNLFLWIALLFVGGFGVIGTGVYSKRRRSARAK